MSWHVIACVSALRVVIVESVVVHGSLCDEFEKKKWTDFEHYDTDLLRKMDDELEEAFMYQKLYSDKDFEVVFNDLKKQNISDVATTNAQLQQSRKHIQDQMGTLADWKIVTQDIESNINQAARANAGKKLKTEYMGLKDVAEKTKNLYITWFSCQIYIHRLQEQIRGKILEKEMSELVDGKDLERQSSLAKFKKKRQLSVDNLKAQATVESGSKAGIDTDISLQRMFPNWEKIANLFPGQELRHAATEEDATSSVFDDFPDFVGIVKNFFADFISESIDLEKEEAANRAAIKKFKDGLN